MKEKEQVKNDNLRLMVFSSAKELGEKIDRHLLDMYGLDKDKYTFAVPITETFFSDGHLKSVINETVRGKDIFAITDIGNYSGEYEMHGFTNHTSPNDLIIQLLDGIGACNSHADKINIIMPLLYAGRQHRKNGRENLLCGMMLYILDNISNRVRSLTTFDAHDQGVEHAIRNMEFDNVSPLGCILAELINDLDCSELERIVFVAPDNGAMGRRNNCLNSFNCDYIYRDAGSFYKRRDYNHVVDGKNPILSHEYSGNPDLEGFTAIVSDDMISSGGSMCDVIEELHNRGVSRIYVIVTFSLFTEGVDRFQEYYDKGMLDGVYTTDLSYIPEDYRREWLHACDCSKLVANVIYNIHNNLSLSEILGDRSEPIRLLEEKFSNSPQTLARRKK